MKSEEKKERKKDEISIILHIGKIIGWIKEGKVKVCRNVQSKFKITTPWGSDAISFEIGGKNVVISSDQHIEGIHFETKFMSYDEVGERAIRCASADIFATGTEPSLALLNISAKNEKIIREIEEGAAKGAEKLGAKIVGGDISKGERTHVSVVVFGFLERKKPISRFGAKDGDHIFITGDVGDSALALAVLKNEGRKFAEKHIPKALEKFLFPPVEKAFRKFKKIMERFDVKFSADSSDGPLRAVEWIALLNKKHVEFFPERLPFSEEFLRFSQKYFDDPQSVLATWGDDYEIVFGISEKDAEKHMKEIRKDGNECIGIILSEADKKRALKMKRYSYIKLRYLKGRPIFIFTTHKIYTKPFSHF